MDMCENLRTCPFYQGKMSMETGLGGIYRKKYCEGNKALCARYIVAAQAGREYVPITLYPNMTDKAKKIIAEHKK